MGFYRHHAIVVTVSGYAKDDAEKVHRFCKESPLPVTEIMKNRFGDLSFMVCPDGSKEGWPGSKTGDQWRSKICDELDRQAYDDGSSPFHYVVVSYDEDFEAVIERKNSGQPGERTF